MAAFASHHVRLALFPLRLDRDRGGYVDIPHSLGRRKVLLITDVNRIRETNNAIFDDIFWVHLAYAAADDGIECLRGLLRAEPHYAPVLSGFEAIDQGRRVLEDRTATAEARRAAEELVWKGNVLLLEHEQRALVQPNLDGLSCAFARLFSIGSALSFEVRGLHDEVSYFTSFYYYALTEGVREVLHARAWPRITRFDDRWRWIVTCIVPRFRRLDLQTPLVDASLCRVFDEARDYASNPCVLPPAEAEGLTREPKTEGAARAKALVEPFGPGADVDPQAAGALRVFAQQPGAEPVSAPLRVDQRRDCTWIAPTTRPSASATSVVTPGALSARKRFAPARPRWHHFASSPPRRLARVKPRWASVRSRGASVITSAA